MAGISEAAGAKKQLGAALAAGVDTLSVNETVTFTKYVKLVLPLDGYVFWVKADLLSQSALLNASRFNQTAANSSPKIVTKAPTFVAKGSVHVATNKEQNLDETVAVNRVVFTAEEEVQDFNQVGPGVIFIATFGESQIRFAFSSQADFYVQADLYHYVGHAVYAAMETQIVDKLDGFDSRNLIVSNSLPIWLGLNGYLPPYYDGFNNLRVRLYPSFAVPDNLEPVYGVVHIDPNANPQPIQAAPYLARRLSHYQLVSDIVQITLYGTRNFEALDFLDLVNQYSLDYDKIGIMNIPVVRDAKRTQPELGILAQKKTVEFQVSYYQQTARDIARQLITEATATVQVGAQVGG